jgi:ParE-like toxin of type II ParDE toxin-antitoxin system
MAELPPDESALIFEKARALERFPRMYSVRFKGRFRRHRRFLAGDWLVFYMVVEDAVYIRALWPARIP